jgi:hypothetical protein
MKFPIMVKKIIYVSMVGTIFGVVGSHIGDFSLIKTGVSITDIATVVDSAGPSNSNSKGTGKAIIKYYKYGGWQFPQNQYKYIPFPKIDPILPKPKGGGAATWEQAKYTAEQVKSNLGTGETQNAPDTRPYHKPVSRHMK